MSASAPAIDPAPSPALDTITRAPPILLDSGFEDRFQIMRELGRGAMGAVFVAFDRELCREVAVKQILPASIAEPEYQQRFRREYRALAAISDPGVHVSGHAYRDEQARMIDLTQPEAFVPVHGTLLHLHRHAALAREKGVAEVLVLENGQIGDVGERAEKSKETAYVGKIPTWDGEPIPPQVLNDRETIARSGIAFVTVLVDVKGRLVCPPAIATRGVLDEKEGAWDLRDIAKEISRALSERPRTLDEDVAEVVRAITRRKLEQASGKKPITVASVLRARP